MAKKMTNKVIKTQKKGDKISESNNTTYLYDLVKLEVPGTDSHFEKGEFQVLKGRNQPFHSGKRKVWRSRKKSCFTTGLAGSDPGCNIDFCLLGCN